MRRQIKTKELRMRFPNSRELFLFARRVIMDENDIRDVELISDIEIGRMIDYDYKYTHQWKFGKKNVHDIVELTNLSRNLGVDLSLVTKIALGEIKADQAFKTWKEEKGAGNTMLEQEHRGESGKLYFRMVASKDRAEKAQKLIEEINKVAEKFGFC